MTPTKKRGRPPKARSHIDNLTIEKLFYLVADRDEQATYQRLLTEPKGTGSATGYASKKVIHRFPPILAKGIGLDERQVTDYLAAPKKTWSIDDWR